MNEPVHSDELYMSRALQLASLGRSAAHPNPMVGAVIVSDGTIIGEGYHEKFGEAHAEVNAINSVKDKSQLKKSKIYVTLEPCAHYGKTPPCADLIIKTGIPEVIIGTVDPFSDVNGRGITKMKDAGLKVKTGILEDECKELNKKFFTAHIKRRPYITLKCATSKDGFTAINENGEIKGYRFSTPVTEILVHKLRSEYDAIMVGSRTVVIDNPLLSTRNYPGRNPVKIILDGKNIIPSDSNIFLGGKVFYFTHKYRNDIPEVVNQIFDTDIHNLDMIMKKLYSLGITSVLVEGGSTLLNQLLKQGLYDDIRIETTDIELGKSGYGRVIPGII